jgi:rhodanese-related sulfurtransferase
LENVARELAAHGYSDVRDYADGKSDWIAAGLPIEGTHKH